MHHQSFDKLDFGDSFTETALANRLETNDIGVSPQIVVPATPEPS
jgi:hypothetical protein